MTPMSAMVDRCTVGPVLPPDLLRENTFTLFTTQWTKINLVDWKQTRFYTHKTQFCPLRGHFATLSLERPTDCI